MKYTLHTLCCLLLLALLTGCETTSAATGNRAVNEDVAQQLAEIQARYVSGELEYDVGFTSGVGQSSEAACMTLHIALIERLYGAEAAVPFRRDQDFNKSPIRIAKCELLETKLNSVSPHWTDGKSRMRVTTINDGEFVITYNFRVTLSKIASTPPSWADELYTQEQIIHSLNGFRVTSIKEVRS